MKRILFGVLLSLFLAGGAAAQTRNIFLTQQEIASLPTSGGGWTGMKSAADQAPGTPNLSDQDEKENVRTLARALVYVRTGTASYRDKVVTTLRQVPGTEAGGRTLALGRKLGAYVIAADLLGYRDPAFVTFVTNVRNETLDGSTLIKKSETKPNNWSSSCIWSRTCADLYIGDNADLDKAVKVFKGMMGDRAVFAFPSSEFGSLAWQSDPSHPVPILPPNALIQNHVMSGGLPEELRRATETFRWPPPCENYVWSALEGYLATAWVLWHSKALPGSFDYMDKAILRAFQWQHAQANCPATGDDTHQPHMVNAVYGTNFPAPSPSTHGKLTGFEDFYARVFNGTVTPPPTVNDIQATFEYHWDPAVNRWSCHRLNNPSEQDVTGSGATTADAQRDWLIKNPGEPN